VSQRKLVKLASKYLFSKQLKNKKEAVSHGYFVQVGIAMHMFADKNDFFTILVNICSFVKNSTN